MSRYFTNVDHQNLIYFQFPKLLMYGEKYKSMSGDSKLFYMLCLDLIKLSMKKGWKDKKGRYYIKMSIETIKDRMNCQNTKATNLKKELVKFGLLEEMRLGQGKGNRLYILQLEYSEADVYKANNDHEDISNDEDTPSESSEYTSESSEIVGGVVNSEKQNSRIPKSGEPEFRKSETIKNDYIKTNSTKTKSNFNNKDIHNLDDDIPNTSAPHNQENINLIISNFREATKAELSERSFKAVIKKVIDKYNQGNVNSFRDYLCTSLIKKIEDLELRRQKENAKQQMKTNKGLVSNRLSNMEIKKVPFYNWLEE
ncbi:replication initiator protein A [Bacillus sp. Au-Bac7]|uniref:replication initiator protein A n=1 Tax=Bacillus sp. Au-Bac7 TaxID=2906458 RepID=UPI001E29E444|nr:replication initiator protein A [Bacillus sp. Au-Bac7]MCE4051879.1 replication initiator protein A [Bacillus sp. Au-Bac7]